MATRYIMKCPRQSYAISVEMCAARRARNDPRCARCGQRPPGASGCLRQAA